MILGSNIETIVKKAVEKQNYFCKGIVQYDYDDGRLVSASMMPNESENPDNHLIEVFSLPAGEWGEINMGCHSNCPFADANGVFDEEKIDENGMNRKECCAYYCATETDIGSYIEENVEQQVREILFDKLWADIEKLNDIRIAISDIKTPFKYYKVREEDWESDVLDVIVDCAMQYGFDSSITNKQYLISDINHLADIKYDDGEHKELFYEVGNLIEEFKLDEAYEMLQNY